MLRILLVFLPLFLYSNVLEPKHILLLNSYNQSMNWVQDITTAVHDTLKPDENNLVIHIENMDTKRIYTKEYLKQLKETYKKKYKNVSFELILSSDNNALDFLKENRNELFGNVPVSFSGINFFKSEDLVGYRNYTGITEDLAALETLKTAIKLNPNTKEVFIINDYMKTGIASKKAIQEELKRFNKTIKIRYSENKTVQELRNELMSLSSDSIVLLGVYFKDKNGDYFTYEKIANMLTSHSKVPVFSLLKFNINQDVIGGNVVSGYYQGTVMSQIAKKILSGVAVSEIPIQRTDSTKAIYNYVGLEKYNFDINKLPKNSLIINKPKNNSKFTIKQKNYLKNKKTINLCIDPNWMPFEAFNKEGKHVGLSSDYFKIFKKESGLKINIVKTNSWSQSLDFAKEHKCDVLSLAVETKERKKYLNFTTPYLTVPIVLATKLDVTFIDQWDQLKNKKIGIVQGYALIDILRKKYPNLLIVEVDSPIDGLNLVSKGELFGYIGSIIDISYISQRSFMGELKIAGKFDEEWKLSVAVRNDDLTLLSIFESVISSLSLETKQNILNKYISIKYEKGIDYTILWQILLAILLICIAALYRHLLLSKANNRLTKIVKSKTEALVLLNKNLENKVEERTNSLHQQRKKLTDLLNNASQGFLSFNKDFVIDDQYSLECEHILGKDIKEKDITKLLFQNEPDKIAFFKETIHDVLVETNKLTSSLLLSLLPSEMIVNKRAILIKYKILSDDKIMIILTNISDKKKLENKIKLEQNILKMIVAIVSDNSHFYETKENFEDFCNDYSLFVNRDHTTQENLNTINALIHTFKGLFAQLYMKNTVRNLHVIESELYNSYNNKVNNEKLFLILESLKLEKCMNEDVEIIIHALGENFLEEYNKLKVDEKVVTKLEDKIHAICFIDSEHKEEWEEILTDVKKIKNKSLHRYLSVYPKLSQQLALSLNKTIHPFEVIGNKNTLIPDNFKPFINSLVHIFRNCCDHGIETKETRIQLNKNEIGTITCEFKKTDNNLIIIISDDGRGINIDRLKEKILDKKLSSIDELNTFTKQEIIHFIFNNDFSTNEKVTDISGRGIGLSAVNLELQKLHGNIKVTTEENKGTTFIFSIPFEDSFVNKTVKYPFDFFDDLIIFTDFNNKIIFANKPYRMFVQKNLTEILDKEDNEILRLLNSDNGNLNINNEIESFPLIFEELIKSNYTNYYYKTKKEVVFNKNLNTDVIKITRKDISSNKRYDDLYLQHKSLLKYIAQGESLEFILDEIIKSVESRNQNMFCSILLLDKSTNRLLTAAAPSLPNDYNNAVNGTHIGEKVGSCGAAAFLKKRVIVDDISTHENWQFAKEIAKKANLYACWSQPLFSSKNEVIGTFAIYYNEPKKPSEFDIFLIEDIASITTIALEKYGYQVNHQTNEKIQNKR